MNTYIFEAIFILLGSAGFSIATYIYEKKQKKKKLICPLRASCDTVIHSTHARFLGIEVEKLGMAYYGAILLLHALMLLNPTLYPDTFAFLAILFSSGAVLFSLYLISVQAFVLRSWCTWCVLSAFTSIAIFIFTLLSPFHGARELFTEYRYVIVILHLIGVILGVGTATLSDILFFRFLKDYKIAEEESMTLGVLSQVVWFALALLIISGTALYVVNADTLAHSGKFLTKLIAIAVLVINGFLLNSLIAPSLVKISFIKDDPANDTRFRKLRTLSFALGAISIVSWYFIFVLGALRGMAFDFKGLLTLYGALILVAVVGSQIFGPRMLGNSKNMYADKNTTI
jgi:uncharacterized membrane protein